MGREEQPFTPQSATRGKLVYIATGRQASVDLFPVAGRLSGVLLSRPFGGSRCVPQSELPLSGKHPSLIGLIRLFAQSISAPGFQCAGPITFPGFQIGANLLIVDPNGALRINGPGGPSLHLPSLNLSINARLGVVAGQVSPIRPASFAATRSLRGGFDELSVRLADDGRITGLSLGRQNAQFSQGQRCGLI